jgi:pyruvate/2-oxoglutarate/acetoin dehydrogenase E1 component
MRRTGCREHGYEVMVVDVRTLKPLDEDVPAGRGCGDEPVPWWCTRAGAPAASARELAALVAEKAFHLLDAPVSRVTAPDVPVPFAPELEAAYRPNAEKSRRPWWSC